MVVVAHYSSHLIAGLIINASFAFENILASSIILLYCYLICLVALQFKVLMDCTDILK